MVTSTNTEFPSPEALLVAQEILFAKVLAGNDKVIRDRAVKKLKRWLTNKANGSDGARFTEDDFLRLWKGLFYCMWMSDKMLIQEELAENLSNLIQCFHENDQLAFLFIKSFFKIMCIEWFGLDQYRIDKFSMLVRRFLRKSLLFIKNNAWSVTYIKELNSILLATILEYSAPVGLMLHFINIFPEELAKIGGNEISGETVNLFLEAFVNILSTSSDSRIVKKIVNMFKYLIRQSDVGLRYNEKFQAWVQVGCPGGDVNLMQKVKKSRKKRKQNQNKQENDNVDEDEEFENNLMKPLDPRAGCVDVELPQLNLDIPGIISMIDSYLLNKAKSVKTKKIMINIINNFQKLKNGKYPFAMKKIEFPAMKKQSKIVKSAASRLYKFEKKLQGRKVRGKKNKKLKAENELNPFEDEFTEEEKEILNRIKKKPKQVNVEKKKIKTPEKKSAKNNEKENVDIETEKKKKSDLPAAVASPSDNNRPKLKVKKRNSGLIGFEIEKINTTPVKNCATPNDWQVENFDPSSPLALPTLIEVSKSAFQDGVSDWIIPEKIKKKKSPAKVNNGEIEITIPVASPRNNMVTSNFPLCFEKAKEKVFGKRKSLVSEVNVSNGTPGKKRISFALDLNESQEDSDYQKKVKTCSLTPYDSSKKPRQSALKPGLLATPMNPFAKISRLDPDFIKI